MPTISSGIVDDLDILQNERVIDMRDVFDHLDPDDTQFYTALSKVGSREAYSSKVEWLETELFPRLDTLAEDVDGVETAVDVTNGSYFRVGDLFRVVTTGECMRVTAVTGNTLTVVRSVGTVAASAAALSGDQVIIIGNAAKQGDSLGTSAVVQRTAQFNQDMVELKFDYMREYPKSLMYYLGNNQEDNNGQSAEKNSEFGLHWRSSNRGGMLLYSSPSP